MNITGLEKKSFNNYICASECAVNSAHNYYQGRVQNIPSKWVIHPFFPQRLDFSIMENETIRRTESRSIALLSYSLPKHATHPHCSRSDTHDNMHDYRLWHCALCRVICHHLDNCASTLIRGQSLWHQSRRPLSVALLSSPLLSSLLLSSPLLSSPLLSGSVARQHILDSRPSVMSLSHSRVPAEPHDSSLCGKCGWLPSCDYSLTHLSNSLSLLLSSSFFPRESSRPN